MNPFERYAASATPKQKKAAQPRVVNSDADAPMVRRGAEQKMDETNAQMRRYNRIKASEYKVALAGPHGEAIRQLHGALKQLSIIGPDGLINLLEDMRWFAGTDDVYRSTALYMIDSAVIRHRLQNGLSPIDDALPGEADTAYQICRRRLTQ